MRLLTRLLKTFIRVGRLSLFDAYGQMHVFGNTPGPSVTVRLHDKRLHTRLALNPELHAAEAYMDGTLTLESESVVYDLLLVFSVSQPPTSRDNLLAEGASPVLALDAAAISSQFCLGRSNQCATALRCACRGIPPLSRQGAQLLLCLLP
jgi:hypothetical protein